MYDETVKRLRLCGQFRCRECEYENVIGCRAKLNAEAADAIEKLSNENKEIMWRVSQVEAMNDSLRVEAREEGIKIGTELATMHGATPEQQKLEEAYLKGVEDGMTRRNVRPVVRGKWRLGGYGQISDATEKWYDKYLQGGFLYCSVCKGRTSVKFNFCPNCGCAMEE